MATNDGNKKKSLWQRAFGTTAETGAENPFPKLKAPPEQAAPAPEHTAPDAKEELTVSLPVFAREDEDIEDRAVRLAGEEQKKREWAAAAMEEVNRAEAARQKADKQAALKLARAKAFALQQQSAAAQEAASAALQDLSAAEQAYSEALRAAEEKRAEEKALRQRGDEGIAALAADNDARLTAANQRLAALAAAIKERRAAAEAAATAGRQAELELEETEAELRRLNSEGHDELTRNRKKIEEIKGEISVVEKQIAVYEARLASEQHSFDKTSQDLAEIDNNRDAARQKVEAVRNEEQALREKCEAELSQLQQEQQSQLTAAEAELERQHGRNEENLQEAQAQRSRARKLDKQRQTAEEKLRELNLAKEDDERRAKESIAKIMSRIDVVRQDVAEKKELYQDAQKQVEIATAKLVKANALAKSSRDKANKAALEENDARMATEMAQKLRSEAAAARNNSDESSSLLLGKAEAVLLAAIDRTNALLEEKRALRAAADAEAAACQQEADQAAAESAAATAAANDMIVVWLAAEESFVKTTGEVEQGRQDAELKLSRLLQDYEQRLEAAEAEARRLKEETAQSFEAAEQAARQCQDDEAALSSLADRLETLRKSCAVSEQALRQALAEEVKEAETRRLKAEASFAKLEQEYEYLRAAHDQSALVLTEKLNVCNSERERLRRLHEEKCDELQRLENQASQLECQYKDRIQALKDRIEAIQDCLRQSKESAAAEISAVEEVEKEYAEACADLETLEKSCSEALDAAKGALAADLAPVQEARRQYEERALLLANRLNEKRCRAEEAVRSATEVFTQRLEAANAVAITVAENEIAAIQEESIPIYKKADQEQCILGQAESAYGRMQAEAAALHSEEDRISAAADEKYRQLDLSTAAALNELEKKLREQIKVEDLKIKEAMNAEQSLESIQHGRVAAQQERTETETARAVTVAALAEQLRAVEAKYQAALKAALGNLPELRQESEAAMAVAAGYKQALDESQQAYNVQVRLAETRRQNEISLPREYAARIEELKARQQIRLNEVKTRLANLEEKAQELQASFSVNSDYAEKSDQAKANVEEYYHKLSGELDEARQHADAEIGAINDRLNELSGDAALKEQLYRDTEKTLANSSELIAAAERAHEDAQIAAAKALAELQSSQAAKETATALAQQASIARNNMDSSTADILLKAAEGLFSAVENAEAIIQDKQAQYDEARQALEIAAQQLADVRAAIGEAPALLEQSRAAWQQAEEVYRTYKEEAEQQIPVIQRRLDAFLEERRDDLAAAENAVTRCRGEAAAAREGVEKLSRQLMDIAAEISMAAVDVQTMEIETAETVSALETEAEHKLGAAKQEREAEEELSARLAEDLDQRRQAYEEAQAVAEQKAAVWQRCDQQYQETNARLTAQYQQDVQAAREQEQAVVSAAAAAEQELAELNEAESAANAAYLEIKRQLSEASVQREQLTVECEEMRRNRERLLKAAQEEKLRLLGTKTIERINAEERASVMLADCQQKRASAQAALKQVQKIEEDLRAAEEKLRNTRLESERIIKLAKSKTAIYADPEQK